MTASVLYPEGFQMTDNDYLKWLQEGGIHIPTQQEVEQELYGTEPPKRTEESEELGRRMLESLGMHPIVEVDSDPDLRAEREAAELFTPDFVIGRDGISAGDDPMDFYVDVQEITAGVWNTSRERSPFFPSGSNPVKESDRRVLDGRATSDDPARVLINEFDPKIVRALQSPFTRKSKKYAEGREGSSLFGLIQAYLPSRRTDSRIHFTKLRWLMVYGFLDQYVQRGYAGDSLDELRKSAGEATFGRAWRNDGVRVLAAPFGEAPFCFHAVTDGRDHLLLINIDALTHPCAAHVGGVTARLWEIIQTAASRPLFELIPVAELPEICR